MDFGYVRVSSKDQNPDRQIKIMLDLGIEERNIYVEKKSGHTTLSTGKHMICWLIILCVRVIGLRY